MGLFQSTQDKINKVSEILPKHISIQIEDSKFIEIGLIKDDMTCGELLNEVNDLEHYD